MKTLLLQTLSHSWDDLEDLIQRWINIINMRCVHKWLHLTMGTSISILKFQDKCLRREPSAPPPPCIAHHSVGKLWGHSGMSRRSRNSVSVGYVGKCYRRSRHDSANRQPSLLLRWLKQKSTNNNIPVHLNMCLGHKEIEACK